MKVVAVMTRLPSAAGVDAPTDVEGPKTRLIPVLPARHDREALQRAMLADVLAAARAVPGAIVRVAVPPGGDLQTMADLGVAPAHLLVQRGDTLGERERGVFGDLFRRGARQVVLVGSDLPLLTPGALAAAFDALARNPGHAVLGPASDGGYYLLGLDGPTVPDLFTGVRFGTKYALMDTLRRCEFESRRVTFLEMLDDVDEPSDLERLRRTLARAPELAPNTAGALEKSK